MLVFRAVREGKIRAKLAFAHIKNRTVLSVRHGRAETRPPSCWVPGSSPGMTEERVEGGALDSASAGMTG